MSYLLTLAAGVVIGAVGMFFLATEKAPTPDTDGYPKVRDPR